ncbi:TlpA family protein disulfide reductase [Thiorhodococcus mannitoliphagus]|uniref:TlpA family protein disulfide reductase n=1 Tax=Thiorhodococcus mannitoliphagus TaxID=329406 RepID=A0A6P1DMV0_9GAMM|nr:TlpA disulfide reductase family protein [Thiorhodococcus mannitoliphagus]NEX19587.1 TlpA family protein disulfide reductase [Thiorhodococcus mannitoliphagus]
MRLKHWLPLLIALIWSNVQAAGVGSPAPGCAIPMLEGNRQVDPAALPGKVVYLDFWASWCGPCVESFPFIEQMHRDLKGQGLEVVAINLDEERQDAEDFLSKHPVSFTIGSDPMGKCPRLYKVNGMPTSYLIDRKGRIQDIHEGFESGDAPKIRAQIESLLSQP